MGKTTHFFQKKYSNILFSCLASQCLLIFRTIEICLYNGPQTAQVCNLGWSWLLQDLIFSLWNENTIFLVGLLGLKEMTCTDCSWCPVRMVASTTPKHTPWKGARLWLWNLLVGLLRGACEVTKPKSKGKLEFSLHKEVKHMLKLMTRKYCMGLK